MSGVGIIGLTDTLIPGYREIGKLHKGGPKGSGKSGFGVDLNYFRFVSDDPYIQQVFHSVYGSTPASLEVVMPYATAGENFDVCKERWGKSGLLHRCDGKTMHLWRGQDGCMHTNPQPCVGGCDETGRLNLLLPDLLHSINRVGIVTLETHSINDIVQIMRVLMQTEQQAREMERPGFLKGVWFMLNRYLQEISVPSTNLQGVRRAEQHWLVEITPLTRWVEQQYHGGQPRLEAGETAKLPAEIKPSDGEIIDGEVKHIALKPAPPAWIARYRQLAERAVALELDWVEIDENVSEPELAALGKELLGRIEMAENLNF